MMIIIDIFSASLFLKETLLLNVFVLVPPPHSLLHEELYHIIMTRGTCSMQCCRRLAILESAGALAGVPGTTGSQLCNCQIIINLYFARK